MARGPRENPAQQEDGPTREDNRSRGAGKTLMGEVTHKNHRGGVARVKIPRDNKEISLERQESYFGATMQGQGSLEMKRLSWDRDPTSTGIEGDLVAWCLGKEVSSREGCACRVKPHAVMSP